MRTSVARWINDRREAQPPAYGNLPGSAKAENACTHSGWTDERTDSLRKLWAEGLSASQIARKMGGITRNSVIGKANRLGLEGRASAAVPRRVVHVAPARPKVPMPKGVMVLNPVRGGDVATAARVDNMAAREKPAENVLQMARAFAPLPSHEPVPFGSKGCKWPVGGDGADMLQCGCERDGDSSYCPTHRAAATVPTSKPHHLARSLRRYV